MTNPPAVSACMCACASGVGSRQTQAQIQSDPPTTMAAQDAASLFNSMVDKEGTLFWYAHTRLSVFFSLCCRLALPLKTT